MTMASLQALLTLMLILPAAHAAGDSALPAAEAEELLALRLEGRSEEVRERLLEHPAVAAKEERALGILALAELDTGHGDEADRLLAHIARPYLGDSWEVSFALGRIFVDKDDPVRALPYYKRARRLAGDVAEIELWRLAAEVDVRLSEEALDALLAFDRVDECPPGAYEGLAGNASYKIAVQRLDKGEMDDRTIDLLKRAAKLRSNDASILVTLATTLILRDREEEAVPYIDEIESRFEARMEEALYLRGLIAEKSGDLEEAFRLATDAINLSVRRHVGALSLAGRVGMKLGRYYEARRHLDRLVVLNKHHYEGRFLLAKYNLMRAEESENPRDVGLYLEEAERNCLFAKVARPYSIENLELLEQVYEKMHERGNKKADLEGVRRDLAVARKRAAAMAKKDGGPQ